MHDLGEPLVVLAAALTLGGRGGVLVRRGVAARLAEAAASLPPGVGLAVVDGQQPTSASHAAGAAVDVTLTVDGVPVWLGSRWDDAGDRRHPGDLTGPDLEVLNRRDLLGLALGAAGFVGDPAAWWHWSHGDRAWAAATGAPSARYGALARAGAVAVPA